MANKYDKLVKKALKVATQQPINESIYNYSGKERISEELMGRIRNGETSLGRSPILPSGDETSFMEKIMVEKFNRVVKEYKRVFDVNEVDLRECMMGMQGLVNESMKIELKHKDKLVEIAVNMVREEYDISEEDVEINASLIKPNELDTSSFEENYMPRVVELEFEDHAEMESAGEEVDKRRFLNAMSQGAAMRTNHMYHVAGEELSDLDPKLPNAYNKMMANINLLYMMNPQQGAAIPSGRVEVTSNSEKPSINAQGVTFPVLVHEIVKGVMEILSSHALPDNEQIAEYAMGKADYIAAEFDDMAIGEALWERFTNMIEADKFDLKPHIYAEMCSKPTKEFIYEMREVLSNTKRGKRIISEITESVEEDIRKDEYFDETGDEPYGDIDDLLNDISPNDIIN